MVTNNNAVNSANQAQVFGGVVTMSGLATATNTNIVYIDPTSGLLTKGAVAASGGGAVSAIQSQLTTSGTFTLNAKCLFLYVECWGGGGGGGGAFTTSNSNVSVGGGGAGGGYTAAYYTAAAAGASFAYTVGAAGLGATGTGAPATAGTTSSALSQTSGGGGGGATGGDNLPFSGLSIGTNCTAPTGGIIVMGCFGVQGLAFTFPPLAIGGVGGNSFGFSGAPYGRLTTVGSAFPGVTPPSPFAGGGSGASVNLTTSAFTNGGNGGAGLIRITQFLSA